MKVSPLQLKRHVMPEVACTANSDYEPSRIIELNENSFKAQSRAKRMETQADDASSEWAVELIVSQESDPVSNVSYAFRIVLVGTFVYATHPANVPEEVFVKTNGSSILYGIAREIIRSLTASGPWGALLIPTISFYGEPAQVPDVVEGAERKSAD